MRLKIGAVLAVVWALCAGAAVVVDETDAGVIFGLIAVTFAVLNLADR